MNFWRGIKAAYPAAGEGDFELRDNSDGKGPFISRWDEAKLGPAPDLAALPGPPVFQGEEAASAQDVDRAVSRRIAGYLAPQWAGDPLMQTRALMRQLEDVAAARDALEDPGSTQAQKDQANALLAAARARRAQVLAYRQEGADFKAARGW
ncbi:MAG: hypothetical protein HYY66_01665 [Candidatus Tectomicrobia bacterium]|nr:hypothetical protein [Candidatus Tectomicrobia bacterium]